MSFDMHVEGIDPSSTHGLAFLTFGDYKRHPRVGAFNKLVEKFIRCFLTPIGTNLSDREYGTTFASCLGGNIDLNQLANLAAQSVAEATQTLKRYELDYDFPLEEKLASVEIQKINIYPDAPGIELYLVIRNAAGTRMLSTVPLILGEQNG